MSTTVFGSPVHLGDDWDDASVYTFFRAGPSGKERQTPPSNVMGALGRTAAPAPGFHANIVITREEVADRTLDAVVTAQRSAIATKLPAAKFVRSGDVKLGGAAGFEMEYTVQLEAPLPAVKQWYFSTIRGPHCYHFCGTATQGAYPSELNRFKAFAEAWGRGDRPQRANSKGG